MMKRSLPIIVAFVAGLLAHAYLLNPTPQLAKAANTPAKEQYKVYVMNGPGGGWKSPDQAEEELNKLAEDGWRVKAGLSYRLVLAR